MNSGEHIYELNALANKKSIVVMTDLTRIMIFDGHSWYDAKLPQSIDQSVPNGAWNSGTATPQSIVVGQNNIKTNATTLYLYNSKSWTSIPCTICQSAMDASYQSGIYSLIIVDKTGQLYIYK